MVRDLVGPAAARLRGVATAVLLVLALLAGCGTPPASAPAAPAPPRPTRTATETLATLSVQGRAPPTGYAREQFGAAWADVDRNGCDTRNDVLGRDLQDKTFKPRTHDCVVLTGRLQDPYTGVAIEFSRGESTSWLVQIDHVVALSDAWQTGAQALTGERRTEFANDPLVLLAVDGQENLQKGGADAASWLPPHKRFRCPYVERQIEVKAKYRLWVKPAEKSAMLRVLRSCPG